jgi:dCMP deaminase
MSKDPSTKVGAVLVRPDMTPAGFGYNGFPEDMPDDEALYLDRNEKYPRVIHAEINAKDNSRDACFDGYTMYSTLAVCDRCFVQLINRRIDRYVYPPPTEDQLRRWGDSYWRVQQWARELTDRGRNIELVEMTIED